MKKLKSTILLMAATLLSTLLTGCFEVTEDIRMHKNGSGSIKTTLNLSQSSTKVSSLMKLKSINGINIPSQEKIQSEAQAISQLLKKTPGISQVQYQLDFKNYIATLSCSFESVNALNNFNKAVSSYLKIENVKTDPYAFNNNSGVFTRTFNQSNSLKKEFNKISETDQKYFDQAYYTQVIRFDQSIKEQKNKLAKVSSNGTTVFLKVKAIDLLYGRATWANSIFLNK